MQSQYAQDMKQILAALQESGAEDEQKQPLPDEETVNTVYIYPTDQGGLLFTQTPIEEDQEPQTIIDSEKPAPTQRRKPPHFIYFLLILLLFVFLDSADTALTALMTPTATITIVTSSHQISTNSIFTIPGNIYRQVSFTETGTSPTTGKGHQNATFAHGYVTFHNSLPQPQTIDTGTLITGNDGVQITTDQTAYVPAGSFSGYGQISVSAHAINPGAEGNIGVGDISGTCCREYILVRNNEAFTGGQNARDFQFVTSADIKDVQSMLFSKINGEVQKAQGQIPTSDTLLTPIPCSTSIQSNHRVGDEGANLTVTVTQNCTIASYKPQVFNERLITELSQTISHQFGVGYTLLGSPTSHITDTKIQSGQIEFSVNSTALYGLDFSRVRTNELTKQIAGQSRQKTLTILKRETGVSNISLNLSNGASNLPTDTTNIHFVVIYQPIINSPNY